MAEGSEGGGAVKAAWGCALSAIVAAPLLLGLVLLAALEKCGGGIACRYALSPRGVALAILISLGIGFGTRLLVNVIFRRLRQIAPNDPPGSD